MNAITTTVSAAVQEEPFGRSMRFGAVLSALENGMRARRACWVSGREIVLERQREWCRLEGRHVMRGHIVSKLRGHGASDWEPGNQDVMAGDWEIYGNEPPMDCEPLPCQSMQHAFNLGFYSGKNGHDGLSNPFMLKGVYYRAAAMAWIAGHEKGSVREGLGGHSKGEGAAA